VAAKLSAAAVEIDSLEIRYLDYHVWHAGDRISEPGFAGLPTKIRGVSSYLGDRLEIDFREPIAEPSFQIASGSTKEESVGGHHAELHGESSGAKAGVPAERSLGTVGVIVSHPHLGRVDCFYKDDPIRADARAPRG
jgi:hypothetical protein